MSFLRRFLIFILTAFLTLNQVQAYSITVQSVTCNVLSVSLTLESWEYLQGTYVQLYSNTQTASTNVNGRTYQASILGRYTSTSLTSQIKFINNRVALFAGKSSVAIGITDSNGNLLPYQGTGDPDIATVSFSSPQGCSTPVQTTSSVSTTPIFTTSSSTTTTFTWSSSRISSSSTDPYNILLPSSSSTHYYTPTPTPDPIYYDTKQTNTGAIAGGVVGGVIVLAILILLAFCIRRRKKAERNADFVVASEFTHSNSNRSIGFVEPDIEKHVQGSNHHEKSIEDCEVVVLEKDHQPLQDQHHNNTSNDPESTNPYPTPSFTQPKAEEPLMPGNPLLKLLNKMNMK